MAQNIKLSYKSAKKFTFPFKNANFFFKRILQLGKPTTLQQKDMKTFDILYKKNKKLHGRITQKGVKLKMDTVCENANVYSNRKNAPRRGLDGRAVSL